MKWVAVSEQDLTGGGILGLTPGFILASIQRESIWSYPVPAIQRL